MPQGNSVVAALVQLFQAFQEQEQLRTGRGPAALEPLLAVDPSPLREALAEVGGQTQGKPLLRVTTAVKLSSCLLCWSPCWLWTPRHSRKLAEVSGQTQSMFLLLTGLQKAQGTVATQTCCAGASAGCELLPQEALAKSGSQTQEPVAGHDQARARPSCCSPLHTCDGVLLLDASDCVSVAKGALW